jgi:integrase
MAAKPKTCRFNVGGETVCGRPIADGAIAACDDHRRKLIPTPEPGVYVRGSRYCVVWRHRGKQHKRSFRTYGEARAAKGKAHGDDGATRPQAKVTVHDYFDQWIAAYTGMTARGFDDRSRALYRHHLERHVLPQWGPWKLAEIEPHDVTRLYRQLRADGVSTSALRGVRAALSAMFAYAVEDGTLRTANPVRGVRIPAAARDNDGDDGQADDNAKALTRAELAVLLAAIPDRHRLFFEFLTHTGLRISEAIGVRWGDVDLGAHAHVKVREQCVEGRRKRLKSRDSRRDVPLSPGMRDKLLARRANGYRGDDAPLFATRAGTPLSRANVANRVLRPASEAVGIDATFHTFRHTCASLLFDSGKNVRQVCEWLGHADPAFTLRTYVHLLDGGVGDAAFLDDALQGGNGGATPAPHTPANAPVGRDAETRDLHANRG